MKVVMIGGTGHVGTYLVPRLVNQGHEVVSVSRQQREPYQTHAAWKSVRQIEIDRHEAEKLASFGEQILALKPEIVIDMICFTLESAKMLVEALRGNVSHFLHCGTIWVHGPSEQVPTDESQPRTPFGEYGIQKAAIESYLLREARQKGFPATILHPGHIVGPGWIPLNPAGNFNPVVFRKLAQGDELYLPNLGMETVHHVHADDVAQAFIQAIDHWQNAVGESFHVVSPKAVTLRGYATAIAKWFGQEPNCKYLPWDEWQKTVRKEDAKATWDHIAHSPNCGIRKAQEWLNYQPRYGSLQAVQEALSWLIKYDDLLSR
jgi:nucleoside-diphosphate-sugar epimerase